MVKTARRGRTQVKRTKGRAVSPSLFPATIPNWINGRERPAASRGLMDKVNPATGQRLCQVTRSKARDVDQAVAAARGAQAAWGRRPGVARGETLHRVAMALQEHRETIARIVALETGKSLGSALGETDGAVALGRFFAGEGQRLYGRTTTSGTANRVAMTVREPLGIAGLIIAANTPIANVAWKVFPALVCGNAAILKAAEDTPATAWIFSRVAHEAGLPPGVLNVIQGNGDEAGAALVAHPGVAVISFTGSTQVGRQIAATAGQRLAKVSLELGGKNPLVVCEDADLDRAAKWVLLSAFSNAGQRCASASRIIIVDAIYDRFRKMLLERTQRLKVGPNDGDDLGPVINERQLTMMLQGIGRAIQEGASIVIGGTRLTDAAHRGGFYLAPTLIEGATPHAAISTTEVFGPMACLYRVKDFEAALALANDSPYGLTAAIHTRNIHRAMEFTRRVQAGVAIVNAGTHGSEPHMPFGGVKQSGNGSREPGTEALDVYSNLKDVYITSDPDEV